MVEKKICNVVPFSNGASNLSTTMLGDATTILAACRDRLVDGVSAVFTRHIGRASDEFIAMADHASSMEQQQLCSSAAQFLSNRSPQLLQQFRATYIEVCTQMLSASTTPRQTQAVELPNELSLLDEEDFEEELAITKLTTRAAFNCSQQLVALDRRLAVLMRVQRMMQEDNPLYPGVIFTSMLQALSRMDVDRQLALTLLQSFERQTAPELPKIYAEINHYLIERGVLPKMSPKTSMDPLASSGDGIQGSDAIAGQSGGLGAPQGPNQDVFSQLLHAIQAASSRRSGGSGWQSAQQVGPRMPGQGMGPQPFASSQLISALGELQRGQADTSMPGLGSVQINPHGSNVLRQIRSTPMANWSQPIDVMTMDIVAMLFDAIFRDPELPASVRAEIAKLQIPVLKVALLDKQFFSEREHPARRLLDAIAQAGIGRNAQDEPRLLAKISSVVDAVIAGFDSDIGIFETQIETLGDFLQDEEKTASDKAVGMVDALAVREREELAEGRAIAEVDSRINHRATPALIADFLTRHWRLVLVDAFARHGEFSTQWSESLQLMDELTWSVIAKSSSQERDRLVMMLPTMLKGLREGIEQVGRQDIWNDFFSDLIQLHVAALRKDAPAQPHPPAQSETRKVVASNTEHPINDDYDGLVHKLEVGAWVEFQSARGTRNTLRLNWVSEFRRVFLFTNRQGENAMTLAASSLADHLRKGTARLLSQNPLTERAVAEVMEQVMPASVEPTSESRPRGYAWE